MQTLPMLARNEGGTANELRDAIRILERLEKDGIAKPVFKKSVLLPPAPRRWPSFVMGAATVLIAVCLLITIPIFILNKFDPERRYFRIQLVNPQVTRLVAPPRAPAPRPKPAQKTTPTPTAEVKPEPVFDPVEANLQPRVYAPPLASRMKVPQRKTFDDAKALEVSNLSPDLVPLPTPALPAPSIVRPRDPIQTGLFGGEVAGGSKKTSAGRPSLQAVNFSEGGASAKGSLGGQPAGVASSGFDVTASSGTHRRTAASPIGTPLVPVKILVMPVPQYTAGARAERIEGDIVLSVVFAATGHVEVLKIIRGLGFGLDDEACTAARQIQFKPATQDSTAVDFPTTVILKFRLAN